MAVGRPVRQPMANCPAVNWARLRLLLLVVLTGGLLVLAPPASAGITSISPSRADVDAGGSATARVEVTSPGVTCLSVTASGPGVTASISGDPCGSDSFSKTLNVSSSRETPGGSYAITVTESAENTSATFTLRVRAASTTTTAAPTTTVAPTTTSSSAPSSSVPGETTTTVLAETTTTTEAPSTTTSSSSTTSTTAPGTPAPFTPVNELATSRPLPDDVVFLPLSGSGYEGCVPLRAACTDPEFALVLLPPSQYDIAWEVTEATTRIDIPGVAPLSPAGTPPGDPATAAFLLPVLDLSQPGGQLRSLPRAFNGTQLVTGDPPAGELVLPVPSGPALEKAPQPFLTSNPFSPPVLASVDEFTDQSPAIVAFSAARLQVLYGVRPLGSWGANQDFIPIHGTGVVPRLVQRADGTTGLAVPAPEGLRLPRRRASADVSIDEDGDDSSFPVAPVLFIASTLLALAVLFVLIRGRRAKATTADEDDDW